MLTQDVLEDILDAVCDVLLEHALPDQVSLATCLVAYYLHNRVLLSCGSLAPDRPK